MTDAEQIPERIVSLTPTVQLPYGEGAEAYKSKVTLTKNPYLESDFKNSEWDKGWLAECDMDDSDSYD